MLNNKTFIKNLRHGELIELSRLKSFLKQTHYKNLSLASGILVVALCGVGGYYLFYSAIPALCSLMSLPLVIAVLCFDRFHDYYSSLRIVTRDKKNNNENLNALLVAHGKVTMRRMRRTPLFNSQAPVSVQNSQPTN